VPSPPVAFSGAILTGGRSVRMGTDKALLAVEGRPLVSRARDALVSAGASEVLAVGGDTEALGALDLRTVADRHPGEGPLGGIVTALAAAREDQVVILPCDHPDVGAGLVIDLVARLVDSTAAAVVPVAGGRLHAVVGAYRRDALPALQAAFDAGERTTHRALRGIGVEEIDDLPSELLVDLDSPDDLRRYALGKDDR
jgi:molybdenum cofactor guanylyltransferase